MLLCTGCSDFLERSPRTSLSIETVYGDDVSLEAAILGCYESLYDSGLWYGGFCEYLNCESGLVTWKGSKKTTPYLCNRYMTRFSTATGNAEVFAGLYKGIYRCNSLIKNIGYSSADEQFNTEIVAEAYLLRALLYFTLTRVYGDVPLILDLPDSYLETNRPRDSYYKIYEQIIKDLDFAEANMRDKERQEALTGGKGRPCNMAAKALKACVYLQIGSILSDVDYQFFDLSKEGRAPDFTALGINEEKDAWKLAYDTATEVIESGVYSLAPSYADLFKWDTPESHTLPERIITLAMTSDFTMSTSCYAIARSLPEAMSENSNSNDGRYRPTRFIYQKWAKTYGPIYNDSRADGFYDVAEGCLDPRMDAAYFHGTLISYSGKSSTIYPKGKNTSTSSSSYLPYFKKYMSPTYTVYRPGDADYYLLRLAEIYLVKAEAAASLSESPGDKWWADALNTVEILHQRARNSGPFPSAQPTWNDDEHVFSTKEELIAAIVYERAFELGGEGHEYFDTHRRGARFMSKYFAKPINEFLNDESEYAYKLHQYALAAEDENVNRVFIDDPNELRKSVINEYPEKEIRYNTAISFSNTNDFTWGL